MPVALATDSRETPVAPIRRVDFLDGLRGFASLQVLALHNLTAFFPALGQVHPEFARHSLESWCIHSPLFYFADGCSAVCLFFIISGAALTYSFQSRPRAIGWSILRRIIRLGLPMAAAVVFGFLMIWLMPTVRLKAGALVGPGDWLALSGPPNLNAVAAFKEIFMGGLFTGHLDLPCTLLPPVAAQALGLTSVAQSFNGPIWTLHLEFYGSLLIIMLVALRSMAGRAVHLVTSTVLLIVFAAHPLGLFIAGHLLAPLLVAPGWTRLCQNGWFRLAGLVLFLAGVATASYRIPDEFLQPVAWWARMTGLPASLDTFRAQSALEALLVFTGVCAAMPLQLLLSTKAARVAGRLSFSLYLVHFPVLLTVTSAAFVLFNGHSGASLLAIMVGLPVTFGLAWLFESFVDQPSIRLSRIAPVFLAERRGATEAV